MNVKSKCVVAVLGATLLLSACGQGGAGAGAAPAGGGEAKKVYMMLPNTTTTRFEARDAPAFKDAMAKYSPGTQVEIVNAQGDPNKQQDQVNTAITQGAAAIVLVAADANLASGSLALAKQAGVPVVLYEHDAKNGPADAMVLFDAKQVGEEQGKRAAELINALPGQGLKVGRIKGNPGEYGTIQYEAGQDASLQPLIDSGKINVVCDQNITNWDPVAGQAFVTDCLTRNNNDVNLFVTMNDGLAGGAVAALTAAGLQGKIPVTGGQNSDVQALQYIAQGYLDNTIMKDLKQQADQAAQVTASIVDGTGVPQNLINGTIDNGAGQIPADFLPVKNITRDNLQDVVDAGIWTWQDICKGIEQTPVCQPHA